MNAAAMGRALYLLETGAAESTWETIEEGRRARCIARAVKVFAILDAARTSTDGFVEVSCPTCARPEGTVNHVKGCVFVGMGVGWERCPTCHDTTRTLVPR